MADVARVWVPGEVVDDAGGVEAGGAAGGGDVDDCGESEGGGDEVADGGEDGGGVAGPDLAGVFAVGDVAQPVDAVLDGLVAADQGGEVLLVGLLGGQVGDDVNDLFVGALAVQSAGVADDPAQLRGAGERQVAGGHDPDAVFGGAAVAGGALPVDGGGSGLVESVPH